jgi:hypothetical protein
MTSHTEARATDAPGLWGNSQDALIAGAGNPQVRSG